MKPYKIYKVVYVDPIIRMAKDGNHVLQIAVLNEKDILETFHMPGTKAKTHSLLKKFTKGIAKDGYAILMN